MQGTVNDNAVSRLRWQLGQALLSGDQDTQSQCAAVFVEAFHIAAEQARMAGDPDSAKEFDFLGMGCVALTMPADRGAVH